MVARTVGYLMREGYAIAIVSAQKMGVDRLKSWRPVRYGSLNVDASNFMPDGTANVDDCRGKDKCPGDPLSWDIMAQIAYALKVNGGERPPMPGLKVNHVIALAESQSAMRLGAADQTRAWARAVQRQSS